MSPKAVMEVIEGDFSRIRGVCPLRRHSIAQERPAKPAPTIITVMDEGGWAILGGSLEGLVRVSEEELVRLLGFVMAFQGGKTR